MRSKPRTRSEDATSAVAQVRGEWKQPARPTKIGMNKSWRRPARHPLIANNLPS